MPSSRTIVSYRPTPDEEGLLDALSHKLGLSKSRTLAFALKRIAEQENVAAVSPTPQEMQAIQDLYAELGPDYWKRRNALEVRQRTTPLNPEEREELIQLIDQGEDWNVRRLSFFFSLAQRYGKPHDYFLDTLGVRHHPLARRTQ
ncbi:hypothetical protein [Armatimonas sp.]|uniref:hypothetical protein n=1 Tax=Armatimonas sp. TaxID=1872638 RepID=UPI003751D1E8